MASRCVRGAVLIGSLIATLWLLRPQLSELRHWLTYPLRQDQAYHRFADARAFMDINNVADTLSSLAFIVVGALGLRFLWKQPAATPRFETRHEMRAYWIFFSALVLTGLGSAYYHQAPDDVRLVWDRLPMAIAFMSLLAAVIAERVSRTYGERLLVPLVMLGIAGVVYWAAFADLWPYAIVQFGSAAALLVLGVLFPSRYTRDGFLFLALAAYGVAKAFELHDRDLYELGHMVSGHTLKHLAAALGGYLILDSLKRRSVRPPGDRV